MQNNQPLGYFAHPSSEKGKPVLVLHAWWGLNDAAKAFCDRLAASGFVVFAPDLYHGTVVESVAAAEAASNGLDADRARLDIAAAVAFLTERTGRDRLAVIGFSLGAFFALDLSETHPRNIESVVVFYGTRPGDFSNSASAYLGHFAEVDQFEPPSEVDRLRENLTRAGRMVSFYVYPGTGHWFFEPDRVDAFNKAAAELAWSRTLAFLQRE
ncbi:MAG: dienelactone hydrolase family protein [Candidatus Zixiibacteriota bacterium]